MDRETSLSDSRRRATTPPLAEAKLLAPRLRRELVSRPRLDRILDAGSEAKVVLVAAPPGYGKTTAVSSWCARRESGLAWVGLDSGDNDQTRLWSYIAMALDRVRAGLGAPALRRLGLATGGVEDVVIELMNGLVAFGGELTLVLDDFHHLVDEECLESIDQAIEQLPPKVRLVIVTRADPLFGIAKLRASGDLAELRTDELAFRPSEARELLVERGGLALDDGDLEALCDRTDGWPGALYLALLWLRSVDDPSAAVREFGAQHRFVADYLNQEVFESLAPDERWFLTHASVVRRFTAPLCDRIFDKTDSAAVLHELERRNLFVARLERSEWYRVHPLLAEYAEIQLAAVDADAGAGIHRAAADWFRSEGLPLEAVEHAAAAGDDQLVAEILVEIHLDLIRTGASRTLLRWVGALPEGELLEHPELPMAAAVAAALVGRRTFELRRYLAIVERAERERPLRFTPYVEAGLMMIRAGTFDRGVTAAVSEGRRAVEIAETEADGVVVASLACYAQALYFAGDRDAARAPAFRAIEHPEADNRPTGQAIARATLALVELDEGNVGAARIHALKAKSLIGGIRSSRSWIGSIAAGAVGALHLATGDLAEAERELVSAEPFFEDEVPTLHHVWLLALIARVRCRRGRLNDARSALDAARTGLAILTDVGWVGELAVEVAGELELAEGRAAGGELLEPPSEAELAVLRLLDSDLSAREIGKELFLSTNTIRTHTRSIYRKLGVHSRSEVVARAHTLGLLEDT